jgi:hypothetical protein
VLLWDDVETMSIKNPKTQATTMMSFASTNVEEEVQRVLRSAGLPSDPIDPSSMDALREMVREEQKKLQQEDDDRKPAAKPPPQDADAAAALYPLVATAATAGSRSRSRSQSPPPPRDTSPPVGSVDRKIQRTLSDLTTPVLMSSSVSSTAGSSSRPDKRILEQLEFQTSLMLDMQRRIEDLTAKVDRLDGGGGVQPRLKRDRDTTPQPEPQNDYLRYDEMTPPPGIDPAPRQAPIAVEQPVPPQPAAGGGFLAHLFLPILAPFNFLFQSRVALILRAFWTQRQGQVQPLDFGLLFKLLFMMSVVIARVQRRNDQGLKSPKFISTIFLIVVGLLYHTKYLQFFYQFCFKDQVPLRIWNGEGADGRPMPPPQRIPVPPNRRAADGNENHQDGDENLNWRHTFLGGIIIPRPNQNPIIAAVQDVFYLLGSFLFSIFPMWRPEGPQEPRQPLIPIAPPVANNNAVPDIPVVAPPRDAMEAADDDEDTDDERQ